MKIKKLAVVLLSAALLLCSCSAAPAAGVPENKSLYTHGLELVGLIDEMIKNESFVKNFTASDEIFEKIQAVNGGDFTKPAAVYSIVFPDEKLSDIVSSSEDYSDALETQLRQRGIASLFTQINALAGVEALAASSVCTAGKTFISDECTAPVTYLYVFDAAAPVAVSFFPGEGGSVSASSCLILNEMFDCSSKEAITVFLSEVSPMVNSVDLK